MSTTASAVFSLPVSAVIVADCVAVTSRLPLAWMLASRR